MNRPRDEYCVAWSGGGDSRCSAQSNNVYIMPNSPAPLVYFDILVRAVRPGPGRKARLSNLEEFRPSDEDVEKCRRMLAARGVTCHFTGFGLACSVPRELFESLFSARLEAHRTEQGMMFWKPSSEPKPPEELASLVEQITIARPPDLF